MRCSFTSAVAVTHWEMLSALLHLKCFDQLNATKLAFAEACSRFVLQSHQAAKRSLENPDLRGLGVMVTSRLDASGGVLAGDFARFAAQQQKSEAFTLKQQRL